MNDFYYAMSLTETMYGISLPEEEWEEIAIVGWNLIGNKTTRTYRYKVCMDGCSDNSIELPCNCSILEAVTTGWEDYKNVSNLTPNGDLSSSATEEYIESRKSFNDPLYQSGKFIKYERVGDTLYFDRPYREVNILYRGIVLDDNDLPKITDKEALAIATYVAYVSKFKEGLMTSNSGIIQLSEVLKQKWNQMCDQARCDQYLSQNEWDQVLEARSNWGRKVHSKSWKFYR